MHPNGALGDDFEAEINPALQSQRRRLFFNMIDEPDAAIRPWHLTVFTHGGDYLRLMHDLSAGRDQVAIKGWGSFVHEWLHSL